MLLHTATGAVPLSRFKDSGGTTWVGSKDVCNKFLGKLAKSTFQHNLEAAGVLQYYIGSHKILLGDFEFNSREK